MIRYGSRKIVEALDSDKTHWNRRVPETHGLAASGMREMGLYDSLCGQDIQTDYHPGRWTGQKLPPPTEWLDQAISMPVGPNRKWVDTISRIGAKVHRKGMGRIWR